MWLYVGWPYDVWKIIGSCNAQLSNRVGEGDDFKQWPPLVLKHVHTPKGKCGSTPAHYSIREREINFNPLQVPL